MMCDRQCTEDTKCTKSSLRWILTVLQQSVLHCTALPCMGNNRSRCFCCCIRLTQAAGCRFILKGAYGGVDVGVMRLLPPSSNYKSIFGVTAKQHNSQMVQGNLKPKAVKVRRSSASKNSETSRPLLPSQVRPSSCLCSVVAVDIGLVNFWLQAVAAVIK